MNVYSNLGTHLKNQRIDLGFTQQELADKLKIHPQFVSNWERGLCYPPEHAWSDLTKSLKLNRRVILSKMIQDSEQTLKFKFKEIFGDRNRLGYSA